MVAGSRLRGLSGSPSGAGAAAGVFVAVVGPSGVGKDSLIAYARDLLAGDPGFVFVRRLVTRRADAALEDHDSLTPADYEARLRAGGFALAWRAHDLGYALPGDLCADLEVGRTVIANISRAAVAPAQARFGTMRIVSITAPRAVVAARLAARGRESDAELPHALTVIHHRCRSKT